MTDDNKQRILQSVHDRYADVARGSLSNESEGVRAVASAFGYTPEDLAALPAEANMGLSCGNPVAMASLRPCEVVVDLGCGGGLDVILAAGKVGPEGKAIGIDMTAEMLERARTAAGKVGAENVEFHHAEIDSLPLPDNSVDCIISNCVINLVPDKDRAFQEMYRVLKPGGRVAISDIALRKPLPAEVQQSIAAYVGCIAGAILIEDYQQRLEAAAFDAVAISDSGADLNAYAKAELAGSSCCDPSAGSEDDQKAGCCGASSSSVEPLHDQPATLLSQFNANEFAASVRIHAVKGTRAADPQTPVTSKVNVEVYDPPMCCSTGVCGPQVDPLLPRFAADLDWLAQQGHHVARFNLAQQPDAFAQNATIQQLLAEKGVECLPVILIDGKALSQGRYPGRDELATWTGTRSAKAILPLAMDQGGCCGDSDCC